MGTGFLFSFPVEGDSDQHFSMLLTNKHVLKDYDVLEIFVTTIPAGFEPGPLGWTGADVRHECFRFDNFRDGLVAHPSNEVDLCGINFSGLFEQTRERGRQIAHHLLHTGIMASPEIEGIMRPIEPVVMVGYPQGIWDEANNLPVVRRGITATHPLIRFQGKPYFLIDAACFPGSSGSPVFLFEDGVVRSGPDMYSPGTRVVLLGVLFAGPQFTAEGTLEPVPIPHSLPLKPVLSMPMNLGYVIHAREILVIGDMLRAAKKNLQ